jgi:hypothetical protein
LEDPVLTGGAWRKREAARRWVIIGAAGAVVVAAGASVAVALGSDRAPAPPRTSARAASPQTLADTSAPITRPAPRPQQCVSGTCTKAQTVSLGGGYAISMWHAGTVGDFRTKPVVELSHDGVAVQWWLWPAGDGWSGALECQAQQCVLTDGDGAHSSVAQVVLLRGGRLVVPAKAAVVADLPTVLARDLDGDADLDVVALDSDYTPNFAQGHLFWNTFQFDGDRLASTGCVPKTGSPPAQLATEPCPARVGSPGRTTY